MHAGMVVSHRKVAPIQSWRVHIKVERPAPDGEVQRDELQLRSDAPCPLRAMHALAMRELSALLPDGEKVFDASMDFYVIPGRAHAV